MRYSILLLTFMLVGLQSILGQSSIANAYDIGTLNGSSTFSDTKNTNLFGNNYNPGNSDNGQNTNDVFYKFTLKKWMTVYISHCGSEVNDTFLNILNATGAEIWSVDSDGSDEPCPNSDQAGMTDTYPPGTYYIVSEGYSENGNITTRVSATSLSLPQGDTFDSPFEIGNKSVGSSYSDTQNSVNFNDDYGQLSSDIYYRFTIAKDLEVSISNSLFGSGRSNVYLLNSLGVEIGSSDLLLKQALTPGTYYIVSEGGGSNNGDLTTNISFATPSGDTFENPIFIGTLNGDATYTNIQNTNNFSNDFGQPSNDVYYNFTISRDMTVSISGCGSGVSDTYFHLLNSYGTEIASNDNYTGNGACANNAQAYIRQVLTAGTYYIVSEGAGNNNGSITTSLQAISSFTESQSSSGQNYILTTMPTVESADASLLTTDQSLQTFQYYDGLGRPSQTVQRAITPSSADLVSSIEYDAYGRESRKWLPGVKSGNNGAYVANFANLSESTNNDFSPYTTTEYEPSPLNRVVGQYGPGADWYTNGKKKTVTYENNGGSNVKRFGVNNNQLVSDGYYEAASLTGLKTIDEDGNIVEEFTDKLGRKVLSRMAGDHDTYYVYDDLNNLRYVLPPMAADALGTNATGFDESAGSTLYLYGYLYHYDGRKRCIEKKLPGVDWIYMVYDRANRLILSQDGNQRNESDPAQKRWTVNKYDLFGRLLYSGLINDGSSRAVMEENYWGTAINESYTGSGPIAGYTSSYLTPSVVLTVNYYDNYGFLSYSGNNPGSMLTNTTLSGYTNPDLSYTKTLLTGTRVYHLDNPSLFEVTALYYDKYARVVQSRSTNHLGGYDIAYNALDFTGKPTKTLKTHNIAGQASVVEFYTYDYDKAQRPTTTTYSLNGGGAVTLASNSYDELGRLTTKKRHTNADTETYAYNVRNWTTNITSGGFAENLYYNANPLNSNATYNGNISYSTWTYNGVNKGYAYTYDNLNRLTLTSFKQGSSSQADGSFNEQFTFDKQGNISALQRKKDNTLIDNLVIIPNGNQIASVIDYAGSQNQYSTKEYNDKASSNEFAYDANGNMKKDLDRNIVAIQYNVLNLPDVVQFKNGNQIKNSYNASGQKLGTEYFTQLTNITPLADGQIISQSYNPGTVDQTGNAYIGTMEYNTQNGNSTLTAINRIYNDEGYVENLGNLQYYYYRKDHLGNNREVWLANTGETLQRTQYYPSGLPWASNAGDNPSKQQRKYNGKEFVEMHGYDTYDYEARGYYPALPILPTVDPLCEKYYSISPYAYCMGNPVKFIDPTGMKVETGSMTKKEQSEYDKMIALLSKSDLFKTLYSALTNSDDVYKISFGQTNKDKSGNLLPGNFKPDSKTDGGSVTFLKGSTLNSLSTTEELAHAYQNENKTLENPNVNPEFEAKTITQLVGEDVAGYRYYDGMTNFQRYLESEYHNVLTPKSVGSSKFQSNYQNAAILYSAYNQANNLGNSHYRQLTLQQPATLMKLVNNTFLKNMPWIK